MLGASTIHHLCKSILLENVACANNHCNTASNSRYYLVLLQYTHKVTRKCVVIKCIQLNTDKLMKFVRELANTESEEKLGKSHFDFRLAEHGEQITGFVKNAITPFGNATQVPIILSQSITLLVPRFFWIGGGEVDAKIECHLAEFCAKLKPFVADVSDPKSTTEMTEALEE